MTTPTQRAAHDQWSRQYLAAVLHRDSGALELLTDVDPTRVSAWDRLDAVAATARDVILAVTTADDAAGILRRELLRDALLESTGQTDGLPE
jgi:hypothetical protein